MSTIKEEIWVGNNNIPMNKKLSIISYEKTVKVVPPPSNRFDMAKLSKNFFYVILKNQSATVTECFT